MKWIYGKQDFSSLERGQENCYLMTNGLGGFSSMAMNGGVTRGDHAFLMACFHAPNDRLNLIHRLREDLQIGDNIYTLSTQEFADREPETGYEYISCFTFEDTPVWKFHVQGTEIRKEAVLEQKTNRAALRYEICNRSSRDCCLCVTPFFQFTEKGSDLKKGQMIRTDFRARRTESRGLHLYFRTNGEVRQIQQEKETYFYRQDICDGRRANGHAAADYAVSLSVPAGGKGTLEIIFETESSQRSIQEILQWEKKRRAGLESRAGMKHPLAGYLVRSADQFISERESTNGSTILAGFPFFEDWGRDTMIALPGICLAAGRFETAREILHTFAKYEKDGLMPNLFPERKNAPLYNTADAALLFINDVYLCQEAAPDDSFVRSIYPVMERIIDGYREGTRFGIHMDEDGLICAGEGLDQVTWMDVRIGEILPTPRHGKPVEINAYWYSALRVMERLATICEKDGKEYGILAAKVQNSFVGQFWREDRRCLKDLVSGTAADLQLRCNQIWAVSMPFTMLDPEKERAVVETVFEKLYTPYGLRTLEEGDPEFHPVYRGSMQERDMAYHQGTVWVFPLGAYYLAYLKVNHYNEEAVQIVRDQLEVMESAMREGCIGQLPEIYDGKNPVSSKGCFAQAWSTGEILRVFRAVEE